MAKVTVVAKVTAKAEAVEAVRGELLKMVAPTRAEDGCLEYRLHQDNADHRTSGGKNSSVRSRTSRQYTSDSASTRRCRRESPLVRRPDIQEITSASVTRRV